MGRGQRGGRLRKILKELIDNYENERESSNSRSPSQPQTSPVKQKEENNDIERNSTVSAKVRVDNIPQTEGQQQQPQQGATTYEEIEIQKKKEKRKKIVKIITVYGFISSLTALINAIEQKNSDALVVTNIFLTFAASVVSVLKLKYTKKTGKEVTKPANDLIIILLVLLNAAGIAVCIALLVTQGVQYGWIVTLLFHALYVAFGAYCLLFSVNM